MTPRVYLVVVIGLVVTLLACVVGIVALSLANPQRSIPDVLQNVTIGNLTGLVGLLVRPPAPTP
jgi:FtsH-binding integral membrane protein